MVLAFTDEQKKHIEEKGMTVVQVKSVMYKVVKIFQPVFDKLWDICKNMSKEQINDFIKECEE